MLIKDLLNNPTRGQVLELAEIFEISPDSDIPVDLVLAVIAYVKLPEYITCNPATQIINYLYLWKDLNQETLNSIKDNQPISEAIFVIGLPGGIIIPLGGLPITMEGEIVKFTENPEYATTVYLSTIYNGLINAT